MGEREREREIDKIDTAIPIRSSGLSGDIGINLSSSCGNLLDFQEAVTFTRSRCGASSLLLVSLIIYAAFGMRLRATELGCVFTTGSRLPMLFLELIAQVFTRRTIALDADFYKYTGEGKGGGTGGEGRGGGWGGEKKTEKKKGEKKKRPHNGIRFSRARWRDLSVSSSMESRRAEEHAGSIARLSSRTNGAIVERVTSGIATDRTRGRRQTARWLRDGDGGREAE